MAGPACVPYFFASVLVANLVILNLFLALLLSSFADMGGNEGEGDGEPDKMVIAFQRMGRFKRYKEDEENCNHSNLYVNYISDGCLAGQKL